MKDTVDLMFRNEGGEPAASVTVSRVIDAFRNAGPSVWRFAESFALWANYARQRRGKAPRLDISGRKKTVTDSMQRKTFFPTKTPELVALVRHLAKYEPEIVTPDPDDGSMVFYVYTSRRGLEFTYRPCSYGPSEAGHAKYEILGCLLIERLGDHRGPEFTFSVNPDYHCSGIAVLKRAMKAGLIEYGTSSPQLMADWLCEAARARGDDPKIKNAMIDLNDKVKNLVWGREAAGVLF